MNNVIDLLLLFEGVCKRNARINDEREKDDDDDHDHVIVYDWFGCMCVCVWTYAGFLLFIKRIIFVFVFSLYLSRWNRISKANKASFILNSETWKYHTYLYN